MSFTDIFIRRPVLASVVSLLILLVGLSAGYNLPVRQYPRITNTTITITTAYPGANADLIKGFITTPIQQAVASSEGIDTLTSSSQQNFSVVTLNLRLDANPDRAVADVLSKVNQVRAVLPVESQDPVVLKQTGETTALMYLSFNSKVLTGSQITDYLTRVIQPRLQTIDGVANAQILGGQTFAMRIWLNPDKMAALGVTPVDVRNALATNNFANMVGVIFASGILSLLHDVLHWRASWIMIAAGTVMLVATFFVAREMPLATTRFILRCLAWLLFDVRIEGQENIPAEGGGLIAANHISYADSVFVGLCTNRIVRFVMWKPIYELPFAREIFDWLLAIPIDATSPKSTIRALRAAHAEIDAGHLSLVSHPKEVADLILAAAGR